MSDDFLRSAIAHAPPSSRCAVFVNQKFWGPGPHLRSLYAAFCGWTVGNECMFFSLRCKPTVLVGYAATVFANSFFIFLFARPKGH